MIFVKSYQRASCYIIVIRLPFFIDPVSDLNWFALLTTVTLIHVNRNAISSVKTRVMTGAPKEKIKSCMLLVKWYTAACSSEQDGQYLILIFPAFSYSMSITIKANFIFILASILTLSCLNAVFIFADYALIELFISQLDPPILRATKRHC